MVCQADSDSLYCRHQKPRQSGFAAQKEDSRIIEPVWRQRLSTEKMGGGEIVV